MTESDRVKPAKAPADRSSRVRAVDEARAELEKRGITEDDIADAVRLARAMPGNRS
jgi:hypothetical protein